MSTDLDAALGAEVSNEEAPVEEVSTDTEVEQVAESTDETAAAETQADEGSTSEPDIAEQLQQMQDAIAEANKKVDAFQQMAIDERTKRQEMQQKPDFWENPDEAISGITQDVDTKLRTMQTNMSVQIMQSMHDDYNDMEAIFVEDAANNPALVAQMSQADNPAKFAYDYGRTKAVQAEFSDPDAYRAKVEAEIRAKIEAENAEKIEAEIKKRSVPSSLANERSTGGSAPAGRPELDKLIG